MDFEFTYIYELASFYEDEKDDNRNRVFLELANVTSKFATKCIKGNYYNNSFR
jgi:hypothetical protein